jgi:hypothetical protein
MKPGSPLQKDVKTILRSLFCETRPSGKKRKLEKPDCHASLAMTASKNKRRILNAPLKLKKQPKTLNKEVRIGLSG